MVQSLDQPPEFFIFASILPWHRESAELCIKLQQIIIIIFAYFFSTFIFYEGWNFNNGNYLFTTDTK